MISKTESKANWFEKNNRPKLHTREFPIDLLGK